MDADALRRAIARMAHEILERNTSAGRLALLGIRRGGGPMAERLASAIERIEGVRPAVGVLDIALHRDDRLTDAAAPRPATAIPFAITDRHVVLVDDVLFTGRTVRAAMDAVIEHGRPATIQLAVLVDRGHRELPIRPDYVGKNVPTSARERVVVRWTESDDRDEVVIEEPDAPA
jgi:pyrimidine operon attenuation protein / uracil phosphoribosyltransferase